MTSTALLLLVGVTSVPADIPFCAAGDGPAYYALELFTTKNVPGTGLATGSAEVSLSSTSPFAVALTADGSYEYQVQVSLDRMRVPSSGQLVAWVTTREVDQVHRMGALDSNLQAGGTVAWNKFLVVITLEPENDPSATTWQGPIVLRGMSLSGAMHTMVGHGAFEIENCATYGYGD